MPSSAQNKSSEMRSKIEITDTHFFLPTHPKLNTRYNAIRSEPANRSYEYVHFNSKQMLYFHENSFLALSSNIICVLSAPQWISGS